MTTMIIAYLMSGISVSVLLLFHYYSGYFLSMGSIFGAKIGMYFTNKYLTSYMVKFMRYY